VTGAGRALPEHVQIVEVGARDGLQNEDAVLATADKVELIRRLMAAGAKRLEVASFVHPRRVPQMADAEAVLEALGSSPEGVSFIGLVLNRRGLERALATSVDEINFVVGATDGFNRANAGVSPEDTMADIEAMVPLASDAGRRTTVTISVSFGCPYEGEVDPNRVVDLARRAAVVGADEIALADTIGVAVPMDVRRRLAAVDGSIGHATLRCHFHDTRNTGIANAMAAVEFGVEVLDASVGGAGGCPFAPNATGNVATEDLLYLLRRSNVATGFDPAAIIETGHWLGARLGKPLPSAVGRAGWFPGRDERGAAR